MKLIKFKLKSSLIPIIKENQIKQDYKVGGVKLVYQVKTFPAKRLFLFGSSFVMPTSFAVLRETKIFLRPYKKNWDEKKNKLPNNHWGKKKHPLTRLWIELKNDYTDITKETPILKKHITDVNFCANLNKSKSFLLIN